MGASVPTDSLVQKPIRHTGRRQKRIGYACEKRIEARMECVGFSRMPLSGSLGGRYAGDLRGECGRAVEVVECKRRASQMKMIRSWLAQGHADLLVIDTGQGAEPLALLTLEKIILLMAEARYGPSPNNPFLAPESTP